MSNSQEFHSEKESSQPVKLTSWDKEPTILELKQELEDARSDHNSHISDVETWLDNLHVEGKAKPKKVEGRSKVQPKLIRKQAEWRYSSLSEPFLSTEDLYNIDPTTHADVHAARQNQLVLNNQFNTKMGKQKFIDDFIRTGVDEGTVIVRVGWNYQESNKQVERPVYGYREATTQEEIQQLQTAVRNPPSEEWTVAVKESVKAGSALVPVHQGTEIVTETVVLANHPTVEICDYRNVIIDPTCEGDFSKANFAIFSFETSLADLKKDSKYKNLERVNVESSSILAEADHAVEGDPNFTFSDTARKKVVAHEYWGFRDIHDTGELVPIVATWVGNTLVRMEENPFPDQKLPFVVVPYLPVRRSIYGEPDGALLDDNQEIIGAVTRGMIDIMGRSANGQTGVRKDLLDVTNKRRFDKGLDYEFNANVTDPRHGVYMHTYPEVPQSAYNMVQIQNQEAESLTGVKAFSSGISGQALGDSVGLGRSALDAASKRELGILRRLADGIVQIGRKVISMNGEFLSEEEVIRITDEEFVTVKRDDLAGNFDLKLSISTAEEDNQKAQELSFMLQTTGNNMEPSMSQMILADIARLRKMPALAKRIEEYQPQPDPAQQMIQQLEIQKLQAEIAKIQSETIENSASAQLDQAKVGTEVAKAENLQSDTDQKNLNFIEQESGVKQERELQKQGEQARSNAGLEVVKASLNQQTNNS